MLTSNRRSGNPSPGSSGSPSYSSAQSSSTDGPQRLFNVAVIGLSGTEREKGASGVGKSCICNRFVRPLEDDFVTDHISTLSQADFSGSCVVNNDHWLYWGERTITVADDSSAHAEWTFRLIEQTEFVDDESFQPLTGSGPHQKESYHKRAAAVKLHSPDKLMYVSKDQLGLETEYEQRPLPDGRVVIDGFIFVYDVSAVPRRSFQQQSDFAVHVLQQVCKVAKKPVVLVAAKYDDACIDGVKEVERLMSRKELRSYSIPVVDCSAVGNINVEAAFSLLGHVIDKCKSKPKILNFKDAERTRREQCDVGRTAFVNRLRMYIPLEEWPRRRVTWSQLMTRLGMSRDPDFIHFCELFGRGQAQKLYRQYVNELREIWMQRKLAAYAPRLPEAFRRMLPDVDAIRGCRWPEVLESLQCHPLFDDYFQPLGTLGADLDPISPDQDLSRPDDRRIPAELLLTSDAEICFANYVNIVEAETKRERWARLVEALR
uniref:Rho GTPase-activating protein FF domain-containing protein n=1 Tax=Plectus sambesii TaxID=2011161 RepID=A0A914VSZ3_9BILA